MERTLVVIRERDLPGLFDLALVVARRRFLPLAVAGLLGIGPFVALNAWLFSSTTAQAPGIPLLVWMLEAPFATAPLTLVLGDLMFGRRPSPVKILATLGRSALPLILLHGFVRFVTFFWLPTRFAFANEVILLERDRWYRVFGRGRELIGDRGGEVVLVGLIQIVLTYSFAGAFFIWTSVLTGVFVRDEITWDMPEGSSFGGWRVQVPIWLATAFFAVFRFLLYIDRRIRLEGWAVKLRLREVGRALEESRRW